MTIYAFADAPPPRALPVSRWTNDSLLWTANGRTWDLSTGAGGVVMMAGVRGLNMPRFTRHTQTSPEVAGSTWLGRSTEEREMFWPVAVYTSDGSEAWHALDTEFWETMHPDVTGVFSRVRPDGTARHIRLRFADADDSYDIAPELVGWHDYGITMVAEQPFYTGDPVLYGPWGAKDQLPFVPADGGPPFDVSPTFNVDSAEVDNPGDEKCWPVWEAHGPTTSLRLGVADKRVVIPFPLTASQFLRLDTDPRDRRPMVGNAPLLPGQGVDRTADLDPATRFGWIEPRSTSRLDLEMVGEGQVSATLTHLYHRSSDVRTLR